MVIRKIISLGNSNCVSLPRAYLQEAGIKIGEYVAVAVLQNDLLVIAPIEKQALLATQGLLKLSNELNKKEIPK